MDSVVAALRLALAAVFAVAAWGKLLDLRSFRNTVRSFGVPMQLVSTVTIVVPPTELGIAATLLVPSSARVGAIAAATMLGVLSAAMAWNLSGGRHPDCNCFGQLRSAPIGPSALARNAALAAAAVFLAMNGASG